MFCIGLYLFMLYSGRTMCLLSERNVEAYLFVCVEFQYSKISEMCLLIKAKQVESSLYLIKH
jgi:hypothetical protein